MNCKKFCSCYIFFGWVSLISGRSGQGAFSERGQVFRLRNCREAFVSFLNESGDVLSGGGTEK